MTEITQADREAADKHGLWLLDDEREDLAEAFARHRQYGYHQGYYDGRQYDGAEERAKIVAWLRLNSTPHNDIDEWADEIEAGAHLK